MARGIVFVLYAALAACSSSRAFDRGVDAARAGDWDGAVRYYENALAEEPDNVEYRLALGNARMEASRAHKSEARKHLAAGELAEASFELELALELDPTNRYLHDELAELREWTAQPQNTMPSARSSPIFDRQGVLDPSSLDPIRLYFPEGTSLRKILETLGKLAGVNILFDDSFRDKPVSVDLEGVSFQEAVDILMQTNGLFYKVMSTSTVLVTPN